jgi:hypothetical protein
MSAPRSSSSALIASRSLGSSSTSRIFIAA